MNFKPLNISLLIGAFSVLHYLFLMAYRNEIFVVPNGFEQILSNLKGLFTLACLFGLTLGAMNFKNHKLLSMSSISLNILGAILK